PESLAWKRLTTALRYQPARFGLEVGPRLLSAGAVVSILTVSEAVWLLVALSETEQSTAWVPSPETLVVQLPEPPVRISELAVLSVQLGAPLRPEPPSLAVTVSVTELVLFQPAGLAVCET